MISDRPAPMPRNDHGSAPPEAAETDRRPANNNAQSAERAAGMPRRIGDRYQVIDELGRGGMAVVYRVRDTSSAHELALKQLIIHQDSDRDRETSALFEREFYTLAQLSHPSVIEVYDYGVDAAGPYYTMELLDGGDLSTRTPLDFRVACELMMKVCSSLSLLHSRRLLHRDISPRNIRCTRDGSAKLIDFGAMVPMGSSGPSVGTPAFIAPEVVHHLSLDARTDLFSLGATLYYALTGRPPFAARAFSELREAWSHEPVPPGQLVAGIPSALDGLLFSLLSIDPARRPRSAFEVMQRLAAIAGIAQAESDDVSQAYLATPTLVARDSEQHRFRQRVRRAVQGRGGGVSIEGAAGLGRSRLLDACVLEGKTLGANVLRITGSSASSLAFESAQKLANQLLEALPDAALRCARDAALETLLFAPAAAAQGQASSAARLLPFDALKTDRSMLQSALTTWITRICRDHPLMIAVDDIESIDEASLALLAGHGHGAANAKLLIVISLETPVTHSSRALEILRGQCTPLTLAPFSQTETESFFRALFGAVPHVKLVADRIHKIAAGNPRESMALAQHMLDRQLIRYTDGQWVLPTELSVTDLPANAEEALRARVAALPELARRLAEGQALGLHAAWSRADYAELVGLTEHAAIDQALTTLLGQGVLVSDGRTYTLVHHTMRNCLSSQLSAADRALRQRALAALSIRRLGQAGVITVHHLIQAGATEPALDVLAKLIEEAGDNFDFYQQTRMELKDIATTLAQAFELAAAAGRRAREIHMIAQHLVGLSIVIDNKLYQRYAPAFLAQLERDSGLLDYHASALPQAERLPAALNQTVARFTAMPEAERVYRVDEAIKKLARFVTVSIVIGVRSRDSRLLASLPGILEPFSGLSPVLYALWQNLVAATEMNYLSQPLRARAHALDVYERLGNCANQDARYVDAIRHAVSYALGVLEVSLGLPSAKHWIEILDKDRMQQVNAMRLRSFQSLYEGDAEAAERYRTRAEVLAVQASGRQMFDSPVIVELAAHTHAGDLTGVKQVADRVAPRAASEPRWRAVLLVAQGQYQRLRGDFAAAHECYEQSMALENPAQQDPPPWLDIWRLAAPGKIAALVELGRADEARSFGLQALDIALQRGFEAWSHDIVRELALAEAKVGDFARASERLDALIAARAAVLPSHLAVDYEARACVAIWAKDTLAAAHFASLAVRRDGLGRNTTLVVRQSRLRDEARSAGLDFSVLPTVFESSVLGDANGPVRRAALTKVTAAFSQISEPAGRALRALEMLCDAAQLRAGQLYLAQDNALSRAATLAMQPDPNLDAFAKRYWAEQLDDSMATCITQSDSDQSELSAASWTNPEGTTYRVLLLKSTGERGLVYVGLAAVRADNSKDWPALYWELSSAVGTRLLELGDAQGVSPN
jgi:serine/threonine protein kinase